MTHEHDQHSKPPHAHAHHGHSHPAHPHHEHAHPLDDDEEALDPSLFGREQPCFGCSPTHPIGFHLRFTRKPTLVRTRWTPGDTYQGPPGIVHGGLVTTIADELAAWTVVGLRGRFGFTASIEARLSNPLRVGVEMIGEGSIAHATSRLVTVDVRLRQREADCFRGTFKFVLLDQKGAEKLLGGPLPADWVRFSRGG